jgi:hypothetical protein
MKTKIFDLIKIENGKVNIIHALQTKWLGTQWVGNGTTYEEIEWLETNKIPKPTKSELEAEVNRLQTEYDSKQYQRNRKYPEITDQLDMIYWDKKNDTKKWQETIEKIKTDNPKPKD